MTDTTVKYFDSTMSGAPTLSGQVGKLIDVLDACLVNGFGSVTLDSLVIASNVATGTISTGHGFAMVGATGPVIKIEGATPSGLNGEWRLASVPTANTFTFATTGISDQTATGTITAKRAPAGFEKAFSGTNLAAYRSLSPASTQLYLRVNDASNAEWAYLYLYETMSDVSTGTLIAPPSGLEYLYKSATANSTTRPWALFADDRAFWLLVKSEDTKWMGAMFFGDINSWTAADAYHCGLMGHSATFSADCDALDRTGANYTDCWLARSYTQIGAAVSLRQYAPYPETLAYPNPAGHDFVAVPVLAAESTTVMRGMMPGRLKALHPENSVTDLSVIEVGDTTLVLISSGNYNSIGYSFNGWQVSGPWRSS